MAWQSSSYGSGIPIKKRRFPIIRSPSPPPEETSPLHSENHSVQKEQSDPPHGSILVNVAESSACLPDAKINSIPGETKGCFGAIDVMVSQSNAGNLSATDIKPVENSDRFSGIKLEESSIAYQSRSLADVDRENKLMGKLLINSAKTELKLAPSENVDVQQHVPERSIISSTELSLGVKGNLNSALAAGQSGQNPRQNLESVGAVSLNLSVSKPNRDVSCKSDKVELNTTSRCNWDLNTTMDAWGGPESDTGGIAEATISSELKTVVKTKDINPSCMTTAILGDGVTSGNKFLGDSECNDPLSIIPFAVPISFQDPLRFCLSSSNIHSNIGQQPSSSSANTVITNSSLTRALLPDSNLDIVNVKSVKSEPLDESVKRDSSGPSLSLSGFREMKRDFIKKCNFQLENLGNVSIAALEDVPKSIKTECVNEGDHETGIQNMLKQSDSQAGLFNLSTTVGGNSSKSAEPGVNTEVNCSTAEMSHEANKITSRVVVPEMTCARPECNEAIISRGKDIVTVETKLIYDPEHCRSKSMNDLQHKSHVEGHVSDEEKINLSGDKLEEYPYGSEYDSDGNLDGRREDEFEDGEVRELQLHSPIDREKIQLVNDTDLVETHASLIGDGPQISYRVVEEDNTKEDHGETISNIEQSDDVVEDQKTIDKDDSVQQSVSVDVLDTVWEEKNLAEVIQREPLDASESVPEAEMTFENANDGSHGTSNVTAQESDQNVNSGLEEKIDSGLPMSPEASLHDTDSGLPMAEEACLHDNTAKDISSGRGRIINLAQPSILSSPSKTRSISDRSLPSAERLPDVALDGDKLHPRGRGEIYSDNSYRFSRERHQDYSSRNPRLNYGRGRGRGRMNHLRDWNSGFDDFYNFPAEPRGGPRHKFSSGVMDDADLEFNGYDIGHDDTFVGIGRRGRKPINGDAPNFHRRRSPGERDDQISHGPQMTRRIPRNAGQESSEAGGMRHSEKFISGFTDDNTDPAFLHPRHQFEGSNGNFVRGNRNFSSVQRRGPPRVLSKSPIRSRTRSPGRRASPGRSSDGFSELPHRRSPQIYRMEKLRSPDHPCFRGDDVARRHGNDFSNEMDSGWEHNPRSGRTFPKNGRRFNVGEREDGNEFFPGPGRFHEMVGDENGEERRRFGERRGGHIRHFRPPYNGNNNNFRVNVEDDPRPFRYGPEEGTEFHQRGPLRDNRGFDRRINKNRPENVHRRTRNIEEQEENFRHGGAQSWHEDDGFGDISRMKRKRF